MLTAVLSPRLRSFLLGIVGREWCQVELMSI